MLFHDTPVLFVVGPTAVGKTKLAISLARQLGGEIVNADSRQVYQYMDIGTAKPTQAEQRLAAHHLLDLQPPDGDFSLGCFLTQAREAIADCSRRGRLPIIAGGAGQYIWALREGWETPEVPPDAEFRRSWETVAATDPASLHRRLRDVDPDRAAKLDPRNLRRIIRALEIHHLTDQRPSAYGKRGIGLPCSKIIGLTLKRDELYRRIDDRVDRMMAIGLLEECGRLAAQGYHLGKGPLACPGYRELGQYLDGNISLAEAVGQTKFKTHRLARRQYSWFKPTDLRINWLDGNSPKLTEQALELAAEIL